MRRIVLLVAAIGVFGTLLISAAPASAHDQEPDDVELLSDEEMMQLHAEVIARESEGIPIEQARQELADQERFGALVAELVEHGGEDLLATAVYRSGGEPSSLKFTQRNRRIEQVLARHTDVDVEVADWGAAFSRTELWAMADKVHQAMFARSRAHAGNSGNGNLPKIYVAADDGRGQISIDIESTAGNPNSSPQGRRFDDVNEVRGLAVSAARRAAPKVAELPEVTVNVRDRSWFGDDQTLYGGDGLELVDGRNVCTTAFRVKKGSQYGFLTAGHCSFTSGGAGGGSTYIQYVRHDWNSRHWIGDLRISGTKHEGSWGDWQMIKSSGTAYPYVYVDNGRRKRMSGYSSRNQFYKGQWTCVFGRSTEVSRCGRIDDLWASNTGGIGRLIATDRNMTQRGDSGGPYFINSTAHGIHQGVPGNKSAFTPVGTPLWYHGLTFAP